MTEIGVQCGAHGNETHFYCILNYHHSVANCITKKLTMKHHAFPEILAVTSQL